MIYKVEQFVATVGTLVFGRWWSAKPKMQGFQVAAVGALLCMLGLILAVSAQWLRTKLTSSWIISIVGDAFAYVGFSLVAISAGIVLCGLVLHWVSIFSARQHK